jgi:hypothetical protein
MNPAYGQDWLGNKLAHNLTQYPLPNIGGINELWTEYLGLRFSLEQYLKDESRALIDKWLYEHGPVVAMHTRGNTSTREKNFTPELEAETYNAIIGATDATVLLLDWDRRVVEGPKPRVKHLLDWHRLNLVEVAYLLNRVACMVGIDSGQLHLTEKWTNAPALGVWFGHHPAHFSIPRAGVTHLVATTQRFKGTRPADRVLDG